MNPALPDFLPTDRREMAEAGYEELDILLVTGDFYVDHPSFGVALIGKLLTSLGFRVGLIFQPDWKDPASLQTMGRPRIAVGVSSGNLDSMVNLYTAARRLRHEDVYSENGVPGKRPPHALTVYAQLAKQAFPKIPVILGGLEASLRRVAHYDYWQDRLRPSVLVDSKADILCYGMGERTMPEIVRRLAAGESLRDIRGTAVLLGKQAAAEFNPEDAVALPSYEEHLANKDALMASTVAVEAEMNPYRGRRLIQRYGDRLLVIEPPPPPLAPEELDRAHELHYANRPHPSCRGRVPAFDVIKNSIAVVRGCPGGCAFCGLGAHQGRQVMSRTPESVLREVEKMAADPEFRGTISDVGGAAGNIFGSETDPASCAGCRRASCLFPVQCPHYRCDGKKLLELLRRIGANPNVKHTYIGSGIRLDLALKQPELLREIIANHVSGQLKIAPEHLNEDVLKLMRKSPAADFFAFKSIFEAESRRLGKKQFLVPLFISNFPGCGAEEMRTVDEFLGAERWSLQQVQDYIPLPMTMGCAMYYTGKTPDGRPLRVNRGLAERRDQIGVLKKKRSGPAAGRMPPEKPAPGRGRRR